MTKILIAGANGYIGTRLLTLLGERGHSIIALVRSKGRLFIPEHLKDQVSMIAADLLDKKSLLKIPVDIDAAYYLVHSMGKKASGFSEMEEDSANNFIEVVGKTKCKQIIYLSGLSHGHEQSEHMRSRHNVETTLKSGSIPVTIFRTGIIIGSGSASFEIIRDLVEKLPLMVAPKWVSSKCEPIAVSDVLYYLSKALLKKACFNQLFEIGGPEKISYYHMLKRFAKLRGLHRYILKVPVLTPRLSSYWLIFVSSTSFPLAQALIDSLKMDAVCKDHRIKKIIPHKCLSYEMALKEAFHKIEQNAVVSSWKNAIVSSDLHPNLRNYIKVPHHGCYKKVIEYEYNNKEKVIERLWKIGGDNGWYFMNFVWRIRGVIDKFIGGAGLRRGRTNPGSLKMGDALDFWRVLLADQKKGDLKLYAEMRVPGEAWLEFECIGGSKKGILRQTATFRPKGVFGRFYWYLLLPIHNLIFRGMCKNLTRVKSIEPPCK